jgi:hypothetical protein
MFRLEYETRDLLANFDISTRSWRRISAERLAAHMGTDVRVFRRSVTGGASDSTAVTHGFESLGA